MGDLAFFGLDYQSTVKDLDKAYRKKAKLLHPDKNGNTEEAKLRFQEMKDRYERLRKRLLARKDALDAEKPAVAPKPKAAPQVPPPTRASTVVEPDLLPAEPIVLPDSPDGCAEQASAKNSEEDKLDRQKLDD